MAKKIMAVDDSASVREMLDSVLTEAGYEVELAVDGEDALKKMERASVQMLITDLNMPKLDGIGLIREVRKNPANRFIPIIMLTTESQEEKRREGKAAGASAWMVKPFKAEQLLAVIRMVVA